MTEAIEPFTCEPDAEHPGWLRWQLADPTCFNEAVLGRFLVRRENGKAARCRMFPQHHHTNIARNVHGGAILGFIDVCLFAGMHIVSGIAPAFASTVEVSTQFMAASDPARPLDAVVEVLRETKRLCFLRGLIVQGDVTAASFSGVVRKAS